MKRILTILIVFLSTIARAQTPEQVMKYVINKDVRKIVSCSTYPFVLDFGSKVDDSNITNAATLARKLNYLYKIGIFDRAITGRLKKMKNLTYQFETQSYNKDGELESESDVIFNFKKTTEGYKLFHIWIAG